MDLQAELVDDFSDIAAGREFLSLIQHVPEVWRQKPAHFHLWLARKRARLTQAELARLAGVSQSFIARVERGRDVRLSTMRRLYAALGFQMLIVPLSMQPPSPQPAVSSSEPPPLPPQ